MMIEDDRKLLLAITDEPDVLEQTRLIHAFYADYNRAQRQSRSTLYFHLAMLCRLADAACTEGAERRRA